MDKHAGGRPTKYKPEYCQGILEFFSKPPYEKIPQEYGEKLVPNPLPFFSDFAYKIGVDDETLANWCKKFPKFLGAYKRCKELQKQFLITNGLAGLYPTGSFCFTAKNITDMRDQQDLKHSGDMNVNINIIKPKSE